MTIPDIILILLLISLLTLAAIWISRNKKRGCAGCAECRFYDACRERRQNPPEKR